MIAIQVEKAYIWVKFTLGAGLMQRIIIGFSLIGSLIVFGLSSGLFDDALMFVLFGIVPGANESVAPGVMLAFWATLAGFLVGRLSQRFLARLAQSKTTQTNQPA